MKGPFAFRSFLIHGMPNANLLVSTLKIAFGNFVSEAAIYFTKYIIRALKMLSIPLTRINVP
jgi:hypothetical protein